MRPGQLANIIREALIGPPIWLKMRADELARGHYIMPVGSAPFLSTDDWKPEACVSIADGEVRIVLIEAREPGTGAFRRLVEGITDAGLRPVVVCPLDHMKAILKRWGWQVTEVGSTFYDREDQWRPPA